MLLHRILFGTAATIMLAGHPAALAETEAATPASESNRTAFTPADFAQFSPQTALDMVRRVPGFAILSDDSGNRGFGQARGNVLIDGQRISAKSTASRRRWAASLRRGSCGSRFSMARRPALRASPARS